MILSGSIMLTVCNDKNDGKVKFICCDGCLRRAFAVGSGGGDGCNDHNDCSRRLCSAISVVVYSSSSRRSSRSSPATRSSVCACVCACVCLSLRAELNPMACKQDVAQCALNPLSTLSSSSELFTCRRATCAVCLCGSIKQTTQ